MTPKLCRDAEIALLLDKGAMPNDKTTPLEL